MPHGESGIVVDAKVFTREAGDELGPGVNQVVRVYIAQKRKISVGDKMAPLAGSAPWTRSPTLTMGRWLMQVVWLERRYFTSL